MKISTHSEISPERLAEVMKHEVPVTLTNYHEYPNDHEAIDEHFSTILGNRRLYQITEKAANGVEDVMQQVETKVHEALVLLLNSSNETIAKYLGDRILKYPEFVDYARETYDRHYAPGLYGRYDMRYDPNTDQVTGIYEYNGDTPTMFFDSVVLQDLVEPEKAFNYMHQLHQDLRIKAWWDQREDNFAFAFAPECLEDSLSTETLANMVAVDDDLVRLISMTHLDFNHLDPEQPFYFNDNPVGRIFKLQPWEDILDERYNTLFANGKWLEWVDSTTFFEPAWRWFVSNKGFWAFLTHLGESGKLNLEGLPFLRTYLTNDRFLVTKSPFVSKPVCGRLANNIKVYDGGGNLKSSTDGEYEEDMVVYQEYHPAAKNIDGTNFIATMWMGPFMEKDEVISVPATLAFREFDSEVNDVENERWIPHQIID